MGASIANRDETSASDLVAAQEPKDARITGTTRSLARRLLALNVHAVRVRPVFS